MTTTNTPSLVDALIPVVSLVPMLKRVRYSYDDDGGLVDLLTGVYNTDLFSYKMEAKLKKP